MNNKVNGSWWGGTWKTKRSVDSGAIGLQWWQGCQSQNEWWWFGEEKRAKKTLHFEPSSICNLYTVGTRMCVSSMSRPFQHVTLHQSPWVVIEILA